jgi:hypothetical protein
MTDFDDRKTLIDDIEILESEEIKEVPDNSDSDCDSEPEEESVDSKTSTTQSYKYRGGDNGQFSDSTRLIEQTNNVRFMRQVGGDERWTTDKMSIYNAVAAIANRAV